MEGPKAFFVNVENSGYSFRPIRLGEESNDLPFLRELYASTRREEVASTGWPKAEIENFLTQQFEAQHAHYQEHYHRAEFSVILSSSGESIGRLYLDEWESEFRIVDIALLPEYRGKGIGGEILAGIIERAFSTGKAVSIHVEQYNPAMHLYRRLGFEMIEEKGVYHLMELRPPSKK